MGRPVARDVMLYFKTVYSDPENRSDYVETAGMTAAYGAIALRSPKVLGSANSDEGEDQ